MDKAKFEELTGRLNEVSKVVEKLDPSLRDHAVKILAPYITGANFKQPTAADVGAPGSMLEAAEFFQKFVHDKPADNAFALAAFHFSQYGSAIFAAAEMRELASEVGITIPDRIDVTYDSAKREGKSLFQKTGKGEYKPTVHGEAFFKKTYEVSKGTQKKEKDKPQTD